MQQEKVVKYGSCLLKMNEWNYPVHDLELTVLMFALKQ